MNKCLMAISVAALLAVFTPQAEARWVRVGVGIGFPCYGGPCYGGPWYGPYGYPYYQPYPYYVPPAPVYVAPAPTVVQPAPAGYQPVPVAGPTNTTSTSYAEPIPAPSAGDAIQADAMGALQQLSNPDEHARAEAALELGRMKAQQALEPLCSILTTDRSPIVRETAARALGLIGNVRALVALQNAAMADTDHEVRHSAQFSAEVIRGMLRRD